MKICPRCSRVYADGEYRFCLDDGADLIAYNEAKTEAFPAETVEKKPASKRRWLIFSVVGAFAVLATFAFGAFFFIGYSGYFSGNSNKPVIPLLGTNDEAELKNIMQKISVAFVEKDRKTLETYLADEYTEEDSNGGSYTKQEILTAGQILDTVSLKYSDLKVSLEGEKAVVTGHGDSKVNLLGTDVPQSYTFKTKFVKRDGKWQAVYSYSEFKDDFNSEQKQSF